MANRIVDEFQSLMEAQIACAALSAAGFGAQVFDQALGALIPRGAVGPFRVVVPEDEYSSALRLLDEILNDGG